MSIKDQVFVQACLLAGELESSKTELLKVLCDGAVNALAVRLRAGFTPESCEVEFVTAASLLALSALNGAQGGNIQEFRAGDLTVKQGNGDTASQCLKRQAEWILGPYLMDTMHFQGV